MTEQHLLLLKEKIIKTDAVINLLAEKNLKQNQLQAKLQFLFEKFLEKSKEAESLHRKVCICLADHEPLKKRVAELETQCCDLETRHDKYVNSSELKFQLINRELEELKKKNGELSKTNEDLKSRLSLRAAKRSKKNSMLDDEIDLLKTENELLSTQVDKLTARCDRESKGIGRLAVLLAETERVRIPGETELKKKVSKLETTEEELRSEVAALRRQRNELEDQLAELRLENNLLGESSVEPEEQSNAASSKKSTTQIEESGLPFIETDFADVPIANSHLREKISKLEFTEAQLRCEIVALKKERNHPMDDRLTDLRLEKNLLKESSLAVEQEQLSVSDRNLLELIGPDLSNKNIIPVALRQTELLHQHKEQLSKSEIAEEEPLRNDVGRLDERLEVETLGIGLTQMELFGADDFEESSDSESVTDLLREMIDLPAAVVPFGDDSCSEIEDCLGFTSADVEDCRICANAPPAMPAKILQRNDQKTSHPPNFLQCQASSGDFNVSAFSAAECYRGSNTLAATTAKKGNVMNINSKLKTDGYKMRKRKPIIKSKHLKRLKLAIAQDMLKCMDKYFQKNLKSLGKFDHHQCSCKRKSPQFRRNEKLIRRKVEKLREIHASDSEDEESSPVIKRRKFKLTCCKLNNLIEEKADAHDVDISNKVVVPKIQKISKGVEKTCKRREDDNKQEEVTCARPNNHDEIVLNVLRKRSDADSEKPELEVISQDSGYARSEADSLELETQNHERIFARSASLNDGTSESPPKKRCDRKTIDIKTVQERKRKCKEEDKTVIKELVVNSEALECGALESSSDLIDLNGTKATCNQPNLNRKISSNCSTFSEKIDSPASPQPDANYLDDSFKLLSPVHLVERTSIYEQAQISNEESSFEVVHTKKQSRDARISSEGRTLTIPEDALKRLKDRIASTAGTKTTAQASFKRPNCAKRVKQVETVVAPLLEPPAVAKPAVAVKKICKMNHAHARRLFKRLLNFGNEPSVVDQVASKFTGQNKKHVASLILSEVCLYTSEKVETKYTPPAPPLTQAQRLLLGFMYKLETSCMSGLLEIFLSAAEKALLAETNLEQLQQITRLYVGVCKFKKDLDRMRRTVCDAFYFMGDFAVPLLFTVLSMWIEVLPLQIHSTDDILVKVLIQVINLKTCKTPGYNLLPLRNLLKVHYEYPTERWNLEEVFREVFSIYLGNPTKSNEYAVLVLCKNHPPKWVLQQLEAQIKNVSPNPKTVDSKILTTLTHLVSQFRSKEAAVDVTSLKTWLSVCLQGGLLSSEAEASVRKCINLLEENT